MAYQYHFLAIISSLPLNIGVNSTYRTIIIQSSFNKIKVCTFIMNFDSASMIIYPTRVPSSIEVT